VRRRRRSRGEVSAAGVARFLAARLSAMSREQAQMTAWAVRSLLRFPAPRPMVPVELAGLVPPVASWRLSGLCRGHCHPARSRRCWRPAAPPARRAAATWR